MSNLVIVAIPEKDDLVWEVSTEQVPHLTLLYLGEPEGAAVFEILKFLDHAATTVLHRFNLEVDRRDTLGEDQADVVFFDGSWDLPDLKRFRAQLLQNDNIKKAYLSAEQFPDWVPHLTLGYPDRPAKKVDGRDRIYSVHFDRVALWIDDYEGPTFPLKRYEYPEAMAMSAQEGKTAVEEILSHYGVKGMKWGKRKAKEYTPTDVTTTPTPKGGVKVSGGKNQPTHPDAVAAKVALQKGKKSGLGSLSNKEMQALAQRLELERKVHTLAKDQLTSDGKAFMDLLVALS